VSPLAAVLKAQHQLRSAAYLLLKASEATSEGPLASQLAAAWHDVLATERGVDAVVFALRDVADPTRGVR
jgi:hypothetical protein